MKRKSQPAELKLGNLYVIDYNDHFEASRVGSNREDMYHPVVIRSIGQLVAITPLQYNLQYSRQVSADEVYTHSIHGIMKADVIQAIDMGPSPDPKR